MLDPATVGTATRDLTIVERLLSDYRSSYAAAFSQVMLALAALSLLASALAWVGLPQHTARAAISTASPQQER